MANTCGDSCVFPVSNLKKKGMQKCSQKCSYFGNYSKVSTNNTITNEAPYTMAKSMYSGKSEVMFNGITYSNTDDNNSIEIYITKPLHTYGEEGTTGVGELIIAHTKNNSGVYPLWVCIPISSVTNGVIGSGTNASSIKVLEDIIDNIPGPPYVTKHKKSLLVRQAANTDIGYNEYDYYASSNKTHVHEGEDGKDKKHSHEHILAEHPENPSDSEKAFLRAYTKGDSDIQNQNNLQHSYKLNDLIPIAPYYFYKGVFNSSGEVTYSNCSAINNMNINVIVFDIKDGIAVSEKHAVMLNNSYNPTSKKITYPLLLDNNYQAIPDTFNNVSYHENPFKNSKEDEIYIDCTPVNYKTTDKTTTILEKDTNNEVLDAGASMGSVLLNFFNSSAFGILLGLIAMIILFRSSRYLLQVIFGKKSLPTPSDITNKLEEVADAKK